MTKMAAMAINSIFFFKSSSSEPEGLWFWNLAWSIKGRRSTNLYKSWHWDDLDLFHGKVNLDRPCIWIEKIVKMSFEGQNLQLIGKRTEFLWFEKDIDSRSHSHCKQLSGVTLLKSLHAVIWCCIALVTAHSYLVLHCFSHCKQLSGVALLWSLQTVIWCCIALVIANSYLVLHCLSHSKQLSRIALL